MAITIDPVTNANLAQMEGSIQQNRETGELYNTGVPGVQAGAETRIRSGRPVINIYSLRGTSPNTDLRVRIKVPESYLTYSTAGTYGELYNLKGIIFPYTPSISYDVKAEYTPVSMIHTNYNQHFYQRSSVGTIAITGKFTVQNEKDAAIYLATTHLLRSLTKMRMSTDINAGSPPPVCRLVGYGDYMLNNVPIVITTFRVDLPDNVDYFTLGKEQEHSTYGVNAVPVVCQIAINCIPMYSRNEMQKFNVTDWLEKSKGTDFRNTGYL